MYATLRMSMSSQIKAHSRLLLVISDDTQLQHQPRSSLNAHLEGTGVLGGHDEAQLINEVCEAFHFLSIPEALHHPCSAS